MHRNQKQDFWHRLKESPGTKKMAAHSSTLIFLSPWHLSVSPISHSSSLPSLILSSHLSNLWNAWGLAAAIRGRRLSTAAAATPLSSLTDALLATRLATDLLATPHLPAALLPAAPLPLPVHLHILRHPALPPASKLSFFLAATPPTSPLLASTFPALLRALAAGSPTLLDELLPFALSCPSPAALLPALLASLLSASRLDAALALLDAAPPDLLPRLAAAALPSLIASPDIIAAVTAATADAGAAAAEGRTGRRRG